MKKYLLLLSIIFTSFSFAQTISSKIEDASPEQYEFLKKVNQYYSDIPLTKQITNFYADGQVIDSKQEFALKDTPFTAYTLGLSPHNKRVTFDYTTKTEGRSRGDITVFKGDYYKSVYSEDKGQYELFVNGKSVFVKKY
jgi:hypothetical protein